MTSKDCYCLGHLKAVGCPVHSPQPTRGITDADQPRSPGAPAAIPPTPDTNSETTDKEFVIAQLRQYETDAKYGDEYEAVHRIADRIIKQVRR